MNKDNPCTDGLWERRREKKKRVIRYSSEIVTMVPKDRQ